MNILVLQDHLRNGGTERQSVLLARAFAGAGHRVTLLTFRPGGALDFPSAPPSLRRAALQPFDTRLDWFAPGLHRAARRLAPDIVLCMGRMANCRAAALQRALPRSTVVTTMRTGKELPRACVRSLRATRHTIANSREAARVLVTRHALPSEKITVIHNALVFPPSPPPGGSGILPVESSGTDTAPHGNTPSPAPVAHAAAPSSTSTSSSSSSSTFNLNSPPHSLRVRNGATAQTVVLLCVAMFRPEKNHRALLKLAARLPRPPHLPPHLPPSPRLSCPSASGAPASGITHPPASGAPVSGTTHPPASGALPCDTPPPAAPASGTPPAPASGALADGTPPLVAGGAAPGDIPDWQLWLAGDGPERAPCEALAARLGLADRVRFLGFQTDPAPLYQTAGIALLASTRESLPNFLVESHAHGVPSVAFATGGVPECGGIAVPPGDADAFLAALLPLMRDPAARARESARVAAHAREHFSPAPQTAAHLRLFGQLLLRPPDGAAASPPPGAL